MELIGGGARSGVGKARRRSGSSILTIQASSRSFFFLCHVNILHPARVAAVVDGNLPQKSKPAPVSISQIPSKLFWAPDKKKRSNPIS
jgi:hypothetical protein